MKHILFVVTSAHKIGTSNCKTGYEFSEVADPYLELTRAGYTVDFASILGGLPPEDGYDASNSNSLTFKNSAGYKRLNFSHRLADVDLDAYDCIFFPGGLGPMVDIANSQLVKSIIAKMYEGGKIVSAVCHGSVAFLDVRLSNGKLLLEGKNITSFTEAEETLKKHDIGKIIPFLLDQALISQGALFSNAAPFEKYVIRDGNIITGQNPNSASDVAKAIIQELG